MARENSLWGAPRIHGELLMLGFTVSQATVSRYLPAPGRRPTQSWRTFLRNQASAFGQYSEERSGGYARLHVPSHWAKLKRSTAAQIATVCIRDRRSIWASRLKLARGFNVAAVALANKNARIIWALLTRGDNYRPAVAADPGNQAA